MTEPNEAKARVTAIDPLQAGTPRVIHPITMVVGTPAAIEPEVATVSERVTVLADGVYTDAKGKRWRLRAGARVLAANFPDLVASVDEERAVAPAENRALTPPENRGVGTVSRRRKSDA